MMTRRGNVEIASDVTENLLAAMVAGFSEARAVDWLRAKFPSFDTSNRETLACDATKNERDYFAEARLLGFVTRMPEDGTSGTTRTSGTVAEVTDVADVPS